MILEEAKRKISQAVRGVKNGMAKLNEKSVIEIRNMYADGKTSLSKLGIIYGVDTKTIHRIVKREQWSQVL